MVRNPRAQFDGRFGGETIQPLIDLEGVGPDDFPAATIADSDDVKIGDWCFAIGNPFLLATEFQPRAWQVRTSVSATVFSPTNP